MIEAIHRGLNRERTAFLEEAGTAFPAGIHILLPVERIPLCA